MKLNRSLSIRNWFVLLAASLLFVPILCAVAFSIYFKVAPQPKPDATEMKRTSIEMQILKSTASWSDPSWQAREIKVLQRSGIQVQLLNASGQTVFATTRNSVRSGKPLVEQLNHIGHLMDTNVNYAQLVQKHEIYDGKVLLGTAYIYDNLPTNAVAHASNSWVGWATVLVWLSVLVIILLVCTWFIGRVMLKPMATFTNAIKRIAVGEFSFELPSWKIREVSEVSDAIMKTRDALRTSIERQSSMEQERKFIISAIVHDLRTPLFSIRGYLEGIETGVASSPYQIQRYIRICRDKADVLEQLVSDLFSYVQLDLSDELPPAHQGPLDFSCLIRSVVEGFVPHANDKNIQLHLDISNRASEKCTIEGDAHLITRALNNVLDNAIRYADRGGEVFVACKKESNQVILIVRDTGQGIPQENIHNVFKPFFRDEASRNRQTGGTGLGLAIAERIFALHRGDIKAENGREGGAVFTVTLPSYVNTNNSQS